MSQIQKLKPFSKECLTQSCELRSYLLRETLKREELENQIKILEKENKAYKEAIELILSGIREYIGPDTLPLVILKEKLEKMKNVRGLFYLVREKIIYLWIFIEKEDSKTELTIAQELSYIFSTFKKMRFDFIIIPLNERKIEDFLPLNAIEVFRK